MALLIAVVALAMGLAALAKAKSAQHAIADATRDAGRRASSAEEDLRREVDVLRKMLAIVASGETVTPEMIEEGQLWRDVDALEAKALVDDASAHVLDVRTPQETAAGIVKGALVIPMDEIDERRSELPRDGKPIVVYCAAGARSAMVCEHLSREGFASLHNLSGGFGTWQGPTETPAR